MNQVLSDTFLQVLHKELIPALGCTEPIAVLLRMHGSLLR